MPCAWRSGRLEEGCQRIGQRFDFMCDGERLDVLRERWPAVEAMLARDDELRVGERERVHSPGIGCVRSAHVLFDAARGVSVARSIGVAQPRCLFLVLLDVRTGRQMAGRHTNLLSHRLESARCQARRDDQPWGGHCTRRSAEFLGESDEKPLRPADVAEPIDVFIPDHFAYELRTALAEPLERLIDVVHGEHDAQVA